MLKEFKTFAMKANLVDLAVGETACLIPTDCSTCV